MPWPWRHTRVIHNADVSTWASSHPGTVWPALACTGLRHPALPRRSRTGPLRTAAPPGTRSLLTPWGPSLRLIHPKATAVLLLSSSCCCRGAWCWLWGVLVSCGGHHRCAGARRGVRCSPLLRLVLQCCPRLATPLASGLQRTRTTRRLGCGLRAHGFLAHSIPGRQADPDLAGLRGGHPQHDVFTTRPPSARIMRNRHFSGVRFRAKAGRGGTSSYQHPPPASRPRAPASSRATSQPAKDRRIISRQRPPRRCTLAISKANL